MADYYKITCGIICEIYHSSIDVSSPKNAERHLKRDMETIYDLIARKNKWLQKLAQDANPQWKQCNYILHALF